MESNNPESSPAAENADLAAVVAGLEQEIETLKANLETQRLLSHPQRARLIQDLIAQIDERQDQLELLQRIDKPQG